MRRAIVELVRLGPFPNEFDASGEEVEQREALLQDLGLRATEEEARALIRLFGTDSFFGLAWTLLHLVESAPGWPYWDVLTQTDNPWLARLRQRLTNAGHSPPN